MKVAEDHIYTIAGWKERALRQHWTSLHWNDFFRKEEEMTQLIYSSPEHRRIAIVKNVIPNDRQKSDLGTLSWIRAAQKQSCQELVLLFKFLKKDTRQNRNQRNFWDAPERTHDPNFGRFVGNNLVYVNNWDENLLLFCAKNTLITSR